jgi:hypothetical protein
MVYEVPKGAVSQAFGMKTFINMGYLCNLWKKTM